MKIVLPHRALSKPVLAWKDIKLDAEKLKVLVSDTNHPGFWSRALSIHHTQVSTSPFNFFVLHPKLAPAFDGHQVIINPKILEATEKGSFSEACMSYPHRPEIKTRRFFKVYASFQTKRKILPGFVSHSLWLEGLPAIVFQHECDHAAGITIYEKFKK